ncbi:MAG: hypothetical protein NC299_07045, partial [Lachnospiraceae bacterium]|nr:hypothetical protein [Lachnospiraceae bacterium]
RPKNSIPHFVCSEKKAYYSLTIFWKFIQDYAQIIVRFEQHENIIIKYVRTWFQTIFRVAFRVA